MKFGDKFRGPEEYVREGQRFYIEKFRGCRNVLDAGCGRGEFLELMKEAGIPARGIDLSEESVALCRRKGLEAETADMFSYLDGLADRSLDGFFCAQVVEHLAPELVPELLRLAHAKLQRDGVLAIETPNPECLAIFATHFYLDPTHTRPIPPALLAFYAEEQGFGKIEIRRFAPASESMPEVNVLPAEVREKFFGSLDYAVLARRLG
jgi:O-antigen chain-terminating methyltransferase